MDGKKYMCKYKNCRDGMRGKSSDFIASIDDILPHTDANINVFGSVVNISVVMCKFLQCYCDLHRHHSFIKKIQVERVTSSR